MSGQIEMTFEEFLLLWNKGPFKTNTGSADREINASILLDSSTGRLGGNLNANLSRSWAAD